MEQQRHLAAAIKRLAQRIASLRMATAVWPVDHGDNIYKWTGNFGVRLSGIGSGTDVYSVLCLKRPVAQCHEIGEPIHRRHSTYSNVLIRANY
jgi:hypothetical protein